MFELLLHLFDARFHRCHCRLGIFEWLHSEIGLLHVECLVTETRRLAFVPASIIDRILTQNTFPDRMTLEQILRTFYAVSVHVKLSVWLHSSTVPLSSWPFDLCISSVPRPIWRLSVRHYLLEYPPEEGSTKWAWDASVTTWIEWPELTPEMTSVRFGGGALSFPLPNIRFILDT